MTDILTTLRPRTSMSLTRSDSLFRWVLFSPLSLSRSLSLGYGSSKLWYLSRLDDGPIGLCTRVFDCRKRDQKHNEFGEVLHKNDELCLFQDGMSREERMRGEGSSWKSGF